MSAEACYGETGRWLVAGMLGLASALTPAVAACPVSSDEQVEVQAVEPRLELRLADHRLIRLVGLDPARETPADPNRAELARAGLAALLAGHSLRIALSSTSVDRWGRLPAFVFIEASGGPLPGGLATRALAAGLGRYLAEPAAHECRAEMLAAEAKARVARLGLWADPYYAVLAADDRAAFAERSGTIILAEGRVIAVHPGPYRTKLRFAAHDGAPEDDKDRGRNAIALAATIAPHALKSFKAAGIDVGALVGKTVQMRGLLDLRFGPQIELGGPDEIVIAPAEAANLAPSP